MPACLQSRETGEVKERVRRRRRKRRDKCWICKLVRTDGVCPNPNMQKWRREGEREGGGERERKRERERERERHETVQESRLPVKG